MPEKRIEDMTADEIAGLDEQVSGDHPTHMPDMISEDPPDPEDMQNPTAEREDGDRS